MAIVEVLRGDITQITADTIVNAANSSLMGGGGVDGAIHRNGGKEILEQCKEYVSQCGRLPVGEAMITTGGNLQAGFVIHTLWDPYGTEAKTMKMSCYPMLT